MLSEAEAEQIGRDLVLSRKFGIVRRLGIQLVLDEKAFELKPGESAGSYQMTFELAKPADTAWVRVDLKTRLARFIPTF